MTIIKNILNDVSEELLAEIPKLQPGEIRTFQCLWGVKVHDAENANVFSMQFGKKRFNLKDTIYDPYSKKTVNIGVPLLIEGDRVIEYKKFAPGESETQFCGKFSLSGDNVEDIEAFEFFMLSNRVTTNKHRSVRAEADLELLGVAQDKSHQVVTPPRTVEIKPKSDKRSVAEEIAKKIEADAVKA
jgi:hypothetical protein